MIRRAFAIVIALGIAGVFTPRLARAEDHLAEAISHTKDASDRHARPCRCPCGPCQRSTQDGEAAEKAKANPQKGSRI
jgi:hypothetical protein